MKVVDKPAASRFLLDVLRAEPGQDFYTLKASQVEDVLGEADRVGYRKPKGANGSRARYFYELLQRRGSLARNIRSRHIV